MKVIYLDHDGVICLSTEWGSRFKKERVFRELTDTKGKLSSPNYGLSINDRFDNFNKKAIKVLNSILKETDAEIVVSSDWKNFANVEEMGDYYESQGIIKRPIGFTPYLSQCTNHGDDYPWQRQWDSEQTRSLEIKQHLTDHPEITHWVAIDDLDMGKTGLYYGMEFEHDWGLDNFVLTPLSNEGIKQCGIKEKILKFLK